MRVGAETHVGRIRQNNEDAFHVSPSLLVVADGMGGHAAGEVASHIAIDTLATWPNWGDPAHELRAALVQANQLILHAAERDPAQTGMGTTLTAALFSNGLMQYAHIGDSRLYLMRAGVFTRLTSDHSVVGELLRIGGLTEKEARLHPQRNIITRALGVPGVPDVDLGALSLMAHDRVLLCTDGLHDMLTDGEISGILELRSDPASTALELVSRANALGGTDNITVVVADITEEDLS